MAEDFVLTFNAPAPWLTANGRTDRRAETSTRQEWRNAAWVYARRARLPKLQRAHIEVEIQFRDNRRRDVANWHNTAKAVIDGLIDYGLLPDDDDKHLIGPDLRRGPAATGLPAYVVGVVTVRIRPLETARAERNPGETPEGN